MKQLDRFEVIIQKSPSMNIPQDIGDKLISLGKLLQTNPTIIKNLIDHGGNGVIVDKNGQNTGKWIYVVEEKK